MYKNIILFVLVSFCGSLAFPQNGNSTQSKSWCKAHAYQPQAKTIEDLKQKFDHKNRGKLVQALWYEVLQKNISGERVVPLLQYLANTEQKTAVSSYYIVLGKSIGIQSLNDEIAKWPKVTQPEPFKSNLQDLCASYEKVGGEDFK